MMEQYLEIKAAHPGLLLFYRMGDFYELFFEDAEIASRTLGIVLTKRGKHQGMDIPMCGVPVERSEDYLHRLINAGHRVAVCEQTENPAAARARGNKSVVRRGVVRLVTPGTLTEDTLLDARTNNYLLAIARARASSGGDRIGLAWIDISTSEFMVTECSTAELAATLARINPNEVIVTDALYGDAELGPLLRELPAVTPLTRDVFDGATAERRLCDYFAVATMDGLVRDVAAGGDRRGRRRHLYRPHPGRQTSAAVAAVARGRRHHHGDRSRHPRQSRTDAHAGRRAARIAARCDRLHRDRGRIAAVGAAARGAAHRQRGDRAAARCDRQLSSPTARRATISAARCAPRPTCRARWRGCRSDAAARAISPACATASSPPTRRWRGSAQLEAPPPEIVAVMAALRRPSRDLAREFERALAEQLPLIKRDGGFVREGYEPALDETRNLRDASRLVVAAMQARYAEDTGIKALKIRHNNVLGYFVEVTAQHGDRLMAPPLNATFIHRQTLAGQVRFTTSELGEIEAKIANAGDRALGLELEIFERLCAMVLAASDDLRAAAHALRAARRRDRAGKARGRRQLRAARGRRLARLCHRRRPASGGRAGAEARRPALHRQRLRSVAGPGAESPARSG